MRTFIYVLFGACTLGVLLTACSGSSGNSALPIPGGLRPNQSSSTPARSQSSSLSLSPALPTQPPDPTPTPRPLLLGDNIGTITFADGDTSTGGQGGMVDGISCGPANLTFHIHSHVSLFHNGVQIAIPWSIGIKPPWTIKRGYTGPFVYSGPCFYNLHSHDRSGIIHNEAASAPTTPRTLGEYFDIWGMPLTTSNIAGFIGPTLIFVGTPATSTGFPTTVTRFTGDPRTIQLTNHKEITLEIGGPFVWPPFYRWGY